MYTQKFETNCYYSLQVTVHVKGKTECYECQPKPVPKSYPVCTITSTPSKVPFVTFHGHFTFHVSFS
jgi:hypothetical protein